MEDLTLKDLWHAQDEKLDRAIKLNLYIIDNMQKQKISSKLGILARFKLWVAILGILFCAFLGLLIWGNWFKNPYFTVSIGMILILTVIAVVVYLKHYVLLKQINYSDSITNTQEKLAWLQISTINITRVLLLQTPFYTTWFWTPADAFRDDKFWMISLPATMVFVLITIWLYINISPKNMHKKWVSRFMNVGLEYKSVIQARDFLTELEEFKKGQ
jgi:hypothetical protein